MSSNRIKETRQTIGNVSRIENLESDFAPTKAILELYSARSTSSHSVLNACTTREVISNRADKPRARSTLYLTGFTRGNMFKGKEDSSAGGSKDMIALSIDTQDGSVQKGVQITGPGKTDLDGIALSINPKADEQGLMIAAHSGDSGPSFSSTMAFYRLEFGSLVLMAEPSFMQSYTHIIPRSIANIPKFTSRTNSSATFMVGDATIATDKKNDVVCNVFNAYGRIVEKPLDLYCTCRVSKYC